MIRTLTLSQFDKDSFRIECIKMQDETSSMFEDIEKMDKKFSHAVVIYEDNHVIKGVLHYVYTKNGVLINHIHVCESSRSNGLVYQLLKEMILHVRLNLIKQITINTTNHSENQKLINKIERFIDNNSQLTVVRVNMENLLNEQ